MHRETCCNIRLGLGREVSGQTRNTGLLPCLPNCPLTPVLHEHRQRVPRRLGIAAGHYGHHAFGSYPASLHVPKFTCAVKVSGLRARIFFDIFDLRFVLRICRPTVCTGNSGFLDCRCVLGGTRKRLQLSMCFNWRSLRSTQQLQGRPPQSGPLVPLATPVPQDTPIQILNSKLHACRELLQKVSLFFQAW